MALYYGEGLEGPWFGFSENLRLASHPDLFLFAVLSVSSGNGTGYEAKVLYTKHKHCLHIPFAHLPQGPVAQASELIGSSLT